VCVCVYIYVCMYIYIYTYIYIYICIYIYASIAAHEPDELRAQACMYVFCMYSRMYVHIVSYLLVFNRQDIVGTPYIYIIYIYIYVYIYIICLIFFLPAGYRRHAKRVHTCGAATGLPQIKKRQLERIPITQYLPV
jgi:hypothetical protein